MLTFMEWLKPITEAPGFGLALGLIALLYGLASALLFPRLGLRPPPGTARLKAGVFFWPLFPLVFSAVTSVTRGESLPIWAIAPCFLGVAFVLTYTLRWDDEGIEESSLFFKRKARWDQIDANALEAAKHSLFGAIAKPSQHLRSRDRSFPRLPFFNTDAMAGGAAFDDALRARYGLPAPQSADEASWMR